MVKREAGNPSDWCMIVAPIYHPDEARSRVTPGLGFPRIHANNLPSLRERVDSCVDLRMPYYLCGPASAIKCLKCVTQEELDHIRTGTSVLVLPLSQHNEPEFMHCSLAFMASGDDGYVEGLFNERRRRRSQSRSPVEKRGGNGGSMVVPRTVSRSGSWGGSQNGKGPRLPTSELARGSLQWGHAYSDSDFNRVIRPNWPWIIGGSSVGRTSTSTRRPKPWGGSVYSGDSHSAHSGHLRQRYGLPTTGNWAAHVLLE
jgi:hypothetical protein